MLCVLPAYCRRKTLTGDLGHRALGHVRPAIGAASPIRPALQEPPPAPVHYVTTLIGRIGKNQVPAARITAVLARPPPKQRRDSLRSTVDAS
jgi:hypothetical protein